MYKKHFISATIVFIDTVTAATPSESLLAATSKFANLCVSVTRNTPGNFSVIE